MGSFSQELAYKCPRTDSCLVCSPFLSSLPLCHGSNSHDRQDYSSVVHQLVGGTISPRLCRVAPALGKDYIKINTHIWVVYVSGVLNVEVVRLSRASPHEWELNPKYLPPFFEFWGTSAIDVFANHQNSKCKLFYSRNRTRNLWETVSHCTGVCVYLSILTCSSGEDCCRAPRGNAPNHSDSTMAALASLVFDA